MTITATVTFQDKGIFIRTGKISRHGDSQRCLPESSLASMEGAQSDVSLAHCILIYCCVTNNSKIKSLQQQTFIMSQFLWVSNSGLTSNSGSVICRQGLQPGLWSPPDLTKGRCASRFTRGFRWDSGPCWPEKPFPGHAVLSPKMLPNWQLAALRESEQHWRHCLFVS